MKMNHVIWIRCIRVWNKQKIQKIISFIIISRIVEIDKWWLQFAFKNISKKIKPPPPAYNEIRQQFHRHRNTTTIKWSMVQIHTVHNSSDRAHSRCVGQQHRLHSNMYATTTKTIHPLSHTEPYSHWDIHSSSICSLRCLPSDCIWAERNCLYHSM